MNKSPKLSLKHIEMTPVVLCSFPKPKLLPLATLLARPESDSSNTTMKKRNLGSSFRLNLLVSSLFDEYQNSSSKTTAMALDALEDQERLTKVDKIVLISLGVIIHIVVLSIVFKNMKLSSGVGSGTLIWI